MSSYGRCCSSHGIISDGYLHPSGYRQVKVCGQNYNVHRVVMLAFKGPPPNEKAWQVHHKDGNRANNRLDNLEYVTPRQNTLHAVPTRRTGGPAKPVMWRRLGTENWTFCTSCSQAAQQLGVMPYMVSKACREKVLMKGFEMQFQEASHSTLTGEEWRPMLDPCSGDHVNNRMVSSFGRVRSQTAVISKGWLSRTGYYLTGITTGASQRRHVFVHRLVALAFLGPPPCVRLTQVNHKDLDKSNNSADNLEWTSPAGNMSHFHQNSSFKRRNGKKSVLSRAHGSTDEWNWHCCVSSAAREIGTDRRNIQKCCLGQRLQSKGHEFKYADIDIDGAKSLPGEEWREVDINVLRDDRIARRGYASFAQLELQTS